MPATNTEPKTTAAYHLPRWLVDAIERRATARRTSKSHEAGELLRLGVERDPLDATAALAAPPEREEATP